MTRYTPDWLQQGTYSAGMDRRVLQALYPNPAASGCAVSVGSGMTVNVAAGQVAVPTANATGTVVCTSDAVEPVALAAAPGSNSRIDLVVCQARGNDLDGGANNDFIFAPVTGTVAASPVAPALPANAVALAQIAVGTGVAAIVAGNITDLRPAGLAVPSGDTAWTNATGFTNGWTAAGGFAPAYLKLGQVVYLRGALVPGTALAAAFTLPVGYRPSLTGNWAATTNTVFHNCQITNAGLVIPTSAANCWLSGLTFPTI